ncbi:MAG: hypothetical protein IJZ23_07625 [Roseburia sp.]|nr:hypothetical protein [Roseburia sp.]
MAASAGRVLLIPRGAYSASVTYTPLDMVRYNNALWVCKKQCTGVTPVDGEFWQLATEYVVDSALSTDSVNPVQNKVITAKLNSLEDDVDQLQKDLSELGLSVQDGALCISF